MQGGLTLWLIGQMNLYQAIIMINALGIKLCQNLNIYSLRDKHLALGER